jgi:NTP pyrophosphatase (non-canonical NTP hydrolase)
MDDQDFRNLRAANICRNEEWAAGVPLSLSFRGNELAGETGEACNILKKLDRERLGLVGSRASVGELAEELADVVICVDLIAMDLGIDLWSAIARKFNKTSDARGLKTKLAEEEPAGSDDDDDHGGYLMNGGVW